MFLPVIKSYYFLSYFITVYKRHKTRDITLIGRMCLVLFSIRTIVPRDNSGNSDKNSANLIRKPLLYCGFSDTAYFYACYFKSMMNYEITTVFIDEDF